MINLLAQAVYDRINIIDRASFVLSVLSVIMNVFGGIVVGPVPTAADVGRHSSEGIAHNQSSADARPAVPHCPECPPDCGLAPLQMLLCAGPGWVPGPKSNRGQAQKFPPRQASDSPSSRTKSGHPDLGRLCGTAGLGERVIVATNFGGPPPSPERPWGWLIFGQRPFFLNA